MLCDLDGLFFQCIVGVISAGYHVQPVVEGCNGGRKRKNYHPQIFQDIDRCIFLPRLSLVLHSDKWGNGDESGNPLAG